MKNVPAIISLATVVALLLLAVAASLFDSIPFALVASYIVGFASAIAFLAMFIADYRPRSPRLIGLVAEEAEAKRRAEMPACDGFSEAIKVNLLSTVGIRNDPATLSFS